MDHVRELDGSAKGSMRELFRDASPRRSVAEVQALGVLRRRMFGRRSEPVTLSRYVLLRRLGVGGTGVVYEAWDPELERKVAIKLLHPGRWAGRDDSRARARLLREAQTLASLSHPNVVPVYDVGSYGDDDEIPAQHGDARLELPPRGVFVVMELIDGETLDRWLAAGPRPYGDVLDVFLAAGRGLAAAHRHGLVHRDFKPANVLVGADGRVRVLDFGLARTAGARRSGDTPAPSPAHSGPITITGTVMGTPAYMAPEQHRGTDVDHRSDQFSFCVALYEGLYGVRPFEGVDTQQLELAKLAEDVQPAPQAPAVPAAVERVLLRGLRKDPSRRFPSMRALLAELSRARRGRRRSLVAVAGALLLVAATALGAVAWRQHQYAACLGQERLLTDVWDDEVETSVRRAFAATGLPFALDAWRTVEGELDAYGARWVELRTTSCEATLVHGEMPRAHMERTHLCLDRRLKSLGEVTGVFADADREVVASAVRTISKLPSLEPCRPSPGAGAATDRLDVLDRETLLSIDAQLSRGATLLDAAHFEEALAAANAALALAADDPHGRARAHLLAGRVASQAAWFPRAEEHLFDAFITAEQESDQELAARALIELAHTVGVEQSRFEEGERFRRQAELKLRSQALGWELEAALALEKARLRLAAGAPGEAVGLFEQALALYVDGHHDDVGLTVGRADDLGVVSVHNGLGAAHYRNGDYARAREHWSRVLQIRRARLGDDHPAVASAVNNLGILACATNEFDVALERYQHALGIRTAAMPPHHPDIGTTLNNIGVVYARTDRHAEALDYFRRALEIWERAYGRHNATVVMARNNIAELLVWAGDYQAAADTATDALAVARQIFADEHPRAVDPLVPLGLALVHLGEADEAVVHLERVVSHYESVYGPVHPKLATPLRGLGLAYLARHDLRRAVTPLRRAVALEREYDDPPALAVAGFALARALWATRPREAVALADEARDLLRGIETRADQLAQVEAWLASHPVGAG